MNTVGDENDYLLTALACAVAVEQRERPLERHPVWKRRTSGATRSSKIRGTTNKRERIDHRETCGEGMEKRTRTRKFQVASTR